MSQPRTKRARLVALSLAGIIVTLGSLYFFLPDLAAAPMFAIEEFRAGVSDRSMPIPDGRVVSYIEGGQGEAIVMIHGFGGDRYNWVRFAAHFTDGFRVIAPDLAGFGYTTDLEGDHYDVAAQGRRVVEFLDELRVDRFHVVGNSMGGSIAAWIAMSHPSRVMTATLIEPAGIRTTNESTMQERIAAGRPHPLVPRNEAEYEEMLDLLFVERPWAPYPVIDSIRRRALAPRMIEKKREVLRDFWADGDDHTGQMFDKIFVPLFVLCGDSNRIFHLQLVERAKNLQPRAKTKVLSRTGHVPMIEDPQTTARFVLEFIREERHRD